MIGVRAEHVDSAVRATRKSDYWHNDADKHDLPAKEREAIDIVDCDQWSCQNFTAPQVEDNEGLIHGSTRIFDITSIFKYEIDKNVLAKQLHKSSVIRAVHSNTN